MFLSTKPRKKISLPISLLKSIFSFLNFRHLNTYSFTRFQSLIFLFILFLVVFFIILQGLFLINFETQWVCKSSNNSNNFRIISNNNSNNDVTCLFVYKTCVKNVHTFSHFELYIQLVFYGVKRYTSKQNKIINETNL